MWTDRTSTKSRRRSKEQDILFVQLPVMVLDSGCGAIPVESETTRIKIGLARRCQVGHRSKIGYRLRVQSFMDINTPQRADIYGKGE
ncbi:hypothetical protein JOF56_005099 [Kibdelosporangium banguiense]|uniref:Uncharacterized protein n=1 Tax=Kibdelosporangium banguiense TaxID=1365924 RepID=A0ABS4TL35_9PSEU|nr:hypothetical protein [Kibdelosporangium banguiense]MBP2324714.1 hypothetical protein [Kibdelosporangium banguiense]